MKSLTTRWAVLLLSTLALLSGALLGQQSPPSDDTYVSSSSPKTKFGSSILLVVGQGSTTYMRFNLAGVPTGATVSKATLRLFVSAVATGGQFDVYNLPATPTWSENTLTYNTPPPALGSSSTGGHPATISTSSMNNFVLLDITATVQGWLANPSTNNGVGLAVVGTTGYISFESKEGVLTSHEPELEIVLNGSSGTGTGTVTSVGNGFGLKGGPITTTGTLTIDTTVVPQLGATGNIFTGNISALSFTGNGAGLTNVNAATLNGVAGYNVPSLAASNNFVGNQTVTGNLNIAGIGSTLNVGGPSIFNMDVTPGPAVTSNCLASAGAACTGFQFNGLTGNTIFNAQINGTTELNVDASGDMTLSGLLNLPVTSATSGIATTGVLTLGGANFAHAYGPNGLNSQNTFFGANAGNFSMTGELNIAIGATALASNTSGQGNTALGSPPPHASNPGNRGALGSNTTGSGNTAVGSPHSDPATHKSNSSSSLSSNTTGSDNTSVGASSLGSNTIGNNNVALGSLAGLTLTAANANTTGSSNTFVGYDSGPGVSTEIDNATALGANALVNCSNCMVLGDSTVPMMVGIGTNSPASTLDVHGTGNFTGLVTFTSPTQTFPNTVSAVTVSGGGLVETGTGSVNLSLPTCGSLQVLQSTGSGWACAAVSSGGGGITETGTITTNSLPLFSGATSVGSSNVFQTGTDIGIGTATPASTLDVNGTVNAANGFNLGGTSFDYGNSSSNNAFLGFAGNGTNPGTGNVAAGWHALAADTTGGSNVAAGYLALNSNTTGSFNVAMGNFAGQTGDGSPMTGNNNTFLGGGAEASYGSNSSGAITNATAIGSNSVVGESNALVLGSIAGLNNATANTNVGIGTTTPQATLDVHGNASITGNLNISGTVTCASGCGGSGGGGSGTITGVTAGPGLSGGGPSGNVTLSLNTTATNTFTGTQMFNVPTGDGIVAQTAGNSNAGISGSNTSAVGGGAGVAGFTASGSGSGVVGTNSSSSLGGGYGVQGLSYNAANPGVGGINNSPAAGGAYGVYGQSLGSTGTGVYGTGNGSGVTGNASSPTGSGVVGTNFSTSGNAYGLYGQSSSPTGTGVYGTGTGTGVSGFSSVGYGVVGQSNGTVSGSAGVYGSSSTAAGIGVVGANNAGGYAGFFSGPVVVQGILQSTGDVNFLGNAAVAGNSAVTGNAAVTGTLAIGGDKPMSHSPRMTFSGSVASFTTSPQPAGYFIPDQPIVITRFTAAVGNGQTAFPFCTTEEYMSLTINGTASAAKVLAAGPSSDTGFEDSGPLNILVPAGTPIYMYGNSASGTIGCQSGSNITATVEYAMQ